MLGSQEVLLFVELDYGAEIPIRLHTGAGSLWLSNNELYKYIGAGDLLSIDNMKNKSELSQVDFRIALRNDTTTTEGFALLNRALSTDLTDRDVCIRLVLRKNLDQRIPTENIVMLKTAKVGSAVIDTNQIVVECYTPASQLDNVYNSATKWSDLHQRKYVASHDYAFRFANREAQNAGITFNR